MNCSFRSTKTRRQFLAAAAGLLACSARKLPALPGRGPNVLLVLADQWRAQATGYAGDPNARTPNLDRLASESLCFTTAVSCCPVCSPYRASLMTGQYPLTHGVFMNDVCLNTRAVSLAQAFAAAGYDTAYIGKWHLDGHGRSAFIPRQRRQGFDYWRAMECTHDYNQSAYYGDENIRRIWPGYDAEAQTREAQQYIRAHAGSDRPFLLVLSWGPPHDPYHTAPEEYRSRNCAAEIFLRPNVPAELASQARIDLAGYYSHIEALDACIGQLLACLRACGIDDDTIFVFTSDHGDLLYSHGRKNKQQPWDESILVPLLIRCPPRQAVPARRIDTPINAPDLMPTLLGLCGIGIPHTVEGHDFSAMLRGTGSIDPEGALIMCAQPFGQWARQRGGREYRGLRTRSHTYVRDLNGPWLLFDNIRDPYQQHNLIGQPGCRHLQAELDGMLAQVLRARADRFLPGQHYIEQWGYVVDSTGTVPYDP